MATTPKSTTTARTRANSTGTRTKPRTTTKSSASRSDTSQVREGVTKARNGATAIVRQSAERAVDVPVGAALTVRDRVGETVESWTTTSGRSSELRSFRTQVTRELNKFERRGGQARRKATQRARSTRNRVERSLKRNRKEAEGGLRKAQERVSELV